MKSEFDVVFVGSGMNSLAGAALLAHRGKRVLVLERNDRLGGCIRTEELFPGYRHDVLSQWYPLFMGSPAYAELKDELHAAGLRMVQSDYTTGLVLPDGTSLALKQDLADAAKRINAMFPGDGDAVLAAANKMFTEDAALTFGLMGQASYSWDTTRLLAKESFKRGVDGMLSFASASVESFRRWSERELKHDFTRALIAPWVLHSGIGPDESCSAMIGKLIFSATVSGGMPVVQGGSEGVVKALSKIIEKAGGELRTNTDVTEILFSDQSAKARAIGVKANGEAITAKQAVVCNVTPNQLYGRLWPNAPQAVKERAEGYRYGRGCMQIHFALRGKPQWADAEMAKVPLVHMTENMEEVAMSVVASNNGLLPARPTLAIGQPTAVDPTRAPADGSILWIQMQELPTKLRGDAAGEIAVPADGRWNEAVREAMADRVQKRLELVMPGLADQIVGRRAFSPADLEGLNCNLVGGDPYSGVCTPDQFFWMRPFASTGGAKGFKTPCKNLFQIGAATHPGPGLGAGSGYLVAQALS